MEEKHDPIEGDPTYREILDAVDREAEELAIAEYGSYLIEAGLPPLGKYPCHVFWRIKKHVLKEKHGIDWQSPAELNPLIWY